jgi:hypothetical protein
MGFAWRHFVELSPSGTQHYATYHRRNDSVSDQAIAILRRVLLGSAILSVPQATVFFQAGYLAWTATIDVNATGRFEQPVRRDVVASLQPSLATRSTLTPAKI